MVGGGGEQPVIDPDEIDLERGERPRPGEFADGDEDDDGESQYFTDAEDRSFPAHSRQASTAYEDYISPCASARASSCNADADGVLSGEHCRKSSCVSEGSLDDIDLEAGLAEIIKASPEKAETNCRICHLGLESAVAECGAGITLGCSCKGDLSYAHKQCADTWFKIRGNNNAHVGDVRTTPLITNPAQPSLYFLSLKGISVGPTLLPVPEQWLRSSTIIDSGASITTLPEDVYEAVKAEFVAQVGLVLSSVEGSALDLCFALP